MEVLCGYGWSRKLNICSFPSYSVPLFNFSPSIPQGSAFFRLIDGIQFKQAAMQAKFQMLAIKYSNCDFMSAWSLMEGHDAGTLQLVMNASPNKVHHSRLSILLSPEQTESEKILSHNYEESQLSNVDMGLLNLADNGSSSVKGSTSICEKDIERRRKIGLANKGRIPWNKGITHNEETRKLISKRTVEALSDPKVRKKMSERPRFHSDQSKARMSSTLKKIWQERLRKRRLQEKCYFTWRQTIAEVAKEGLSDQDLLEWDSYERMKSEIVSQCLQQKAAKKAKDKEIAKLRKEEAAKVRAKKAARLAQLMIEKKKAKARETNALAQKKSQDVKVKTESLKLKAKLTKFHHRKRQLQRSVNIQRSITVEPQLVIDNLDIDQIKIEKMRRISFADQIQAVKSRKADFNSITFLANTFSASSSEEEPGDS